MINFVDVFFVVFEHNVVFVFCFFFYHEKQLCKNGVWTYLRLLMRLRINIAT